MFAYLSLSPAVMHTVQLFARAGGGGSGSGSGGGVGSISLIGYIPAHYVTQWTYKRYGRGPAMIVGWLTTIACTVAAAIIMRPLTIFILIGAVVGVYSGAHNWLHRLGKSIRRTKKQLSVSAAADPAWQQENLLQHARQLFLQYQHDWSDANLASMQRYLSPHYYAHVRLMLLALYEMGRYNAMDNIQIKTTVITEAIDAQDDDHDAYTVAFEAQANDKLLDGRTNQILYADSGTFQEFWHFDREGSTWVIRDITQATQDRGRLNPALEAFANLNSMFYSPDWGRLLLPSRGVLFSGASFAKSDINNHVIGQWHDRIVQLYTYDKDTKNDGMDQYLVAQVSLPKQYGGIQILRCSAWSWFSHPPRGYQKYTFEWPDFNQRYNVYATDPDRLAAFELLNPAFMAYLYDQNLLVNIEVVDNIVYLYSKIQFDPSRYESMLNILIKAFRELKL